MLKNMCIDIKVTDLGVRDYDEVLALQTEEFEKRIAQKKAGLPCDKDLVMLVEHFPVITLGRHAKEGNLLHTRGWLQESAGVKVREIGRGGDVTFHGPGQLVVYPIIDLQRRGLGVKDYVAAIEEAVIRTLRDFSVESERVEGATGVWLGKGTPSERKICAIGIKCSRFLTMHGLALNVNTDLSYFSLINPCGFIDKGVTSLEREMGKKVDMALVKGRLVGHLKEIL